MIVTIQDLRTIPGFSPRPGFCARGGRAWFERYDLDWSAFVRDGIDERTLTGTGDGLALALVQWAHERAAQATEAGDGR